MKNTFIALVCLMATAAFAQSNTGITPPYLTNSVHGVTDLALPTTRGQFWTWAIAAVAPLIVAGVKKLVPNIPKLLLPVSTPLIGLALGYGLNALGQANMGWVDMCQAGALAVFVRETLDQAVKQATKSS